MAPIRILVVDDSLVVRKMLSDTLSADAELEVVGSASDGRLALSKIPVLKPDLITLDVEMPVMNGLEMLAALRKQYPKMPVPIVVVQHMPPIFTRLLAERLCSQSLIEVGEGSVGMLLAPAQAWIAPGDFHMTVARAGLNARLQLNQEPAENSCRPAVDVLFRSVAAAFGAGVLGVVMTGMGSDGVAGAQQIRKAGGEVIIQDESSSIIWGMPGLVYAAGQADAVYPLNRLAGEIIRRVQQRRGPAASLFSKIQATLEPRAK